jgi:twitching motility protein PilJ
MSVLDPIKNLFAKKPAESEADSRLSLAMPGQGGDAEPPETVLVSRQVAPSRPAVLAEQPQGAVPLVDGELITLPGLGARPAAQHQRLLGILLGASLLLLAGVTIFALNQSDKVAQQLGVAGQSLMQSQRLAKSVSQALVGNVAAFADVTDSADILVKSTRGLQDGDSAQRLSALDSSLQSDLEKLTPVVEKAEKNAKVVLQQQKTLTQIGEALRQINRQSAKLLETAQGISALKVQQNAPAAEMSAVGQLIMLTQRIGKSSNEFLTADGVSPEAVFLLGKDLASFKEVTLGLQNGSAELHVGAAHDAATREQLDTLMKQYEELRGKSGAILDNLQGLVAARAAQTSIVADSEPLRHDLEALQARLAAQTGVGGAAVALLALAAALALLSAGGLSYVQLQESRRRQSAADAQRLEAERQEQHAKRVNDANQAAILRLMNELQTVAEGDLTQEATVTEDITGAIADSVNYTVEELRSLVSNVQNTAAQVAQTTSDVDATSTELLAASKEQLHEIRETGQNVLDMAGRINDVSVQAQESARVARQSLQAAESGLTAVQNAIGGMNSIREQIQETSKRIKRLGESSQEIGEITELISDITEQTNVLALNAAIQAASAGEAGRGFSVVAEEVQRLAERSGDATRQIAALVKAIQTDTQDAMGAMERSTQGVVEGAKLSDNAGTALTEIDRVSRRVADLIEQISNSASREAGLANEVAQDIQHIFAVTEQTGEGTRVTAGQVRELSRMAEELRQSVSRFKIV